IRDGHVTGVQTCALPIFRMAVAGFSPVRSNAVGTYTYRTTFDLTGLNPATAILTGQFASDNGAIIKLNGVTVGPSNSTYNAFTRSEERRVGKECRSRWWE